MLQRPGSSWGFGALLKDTSVVVLKEHTPPTIPAGPEIRTHNLPLTSPTRYPLGHEIYIQVIKYLCYHKHLHNITLAWRTLLKTETIFSHEDILFTRGATQLKTDAAVKQNIFTSKSLNAWYHSIKVNKNKEDMDGQDIPKKKQNIQGKQSLAKLKYFPWEHRFIFTCFIQKSEKELHC